MKYQYRHITESDLVIEEGTQTLPAAVALLNQLGRQGWRYVGHSGDLDDSFVILLEQEIEDDA